MAFVLECLGMSPECSFYWNVLLQVSVGSPNPAWRNSQPPTLSIKNFSTRLTRTWHGKYRRKSCPRFLSSISKYFLDVTHFILPLKFLEIPTFKVLLVIAVKWKFKVQQERFNANINATLSKESPSKSSPSVRLAMCKKSVNERLWR